MADPPRVLIVEDNDDIRLLLARLVQQDIPSIQIYLAQTLADGQALLRTQTVDILLIDPRLPDSTGYHTIHALMDAAPHAVAAIITGYPTPEDMARVLASGAHAYYDKFELLRDWHQVQLLHALIAAVTLHGT